jgi:ribonuclease HII
VEALLLGQSLPRTRSGEEYPAQRGEVVVKPFDSSRMAGLAQGDSNNFVIAIDGKFPIPNFSVTQETIVGGDNKVLSIAAASIIAKVYRDELMQKHHEEYPVYNFAQHKGYGTLHHRSMILQHGLSPLHRISFCENFVSR